MKIGDKVCLSSKGTLDSSWSSYDELLEKLGGVRNLAGKVVDIDDGDENQLMIEFVVSLRFFHCGSSSYQTRDPYCYWVYPSEIKKFAEQKTGW